VSSQAREFLRMSRNLGSVFTIEDMAEGHLDEAMKEIGELENYAYEEMRHERIDISEYIFMVARWLMLFWILMIATIYHPSRAVEFGGRS
jgi:hypothetical protein